MPLQPTLEATVDDDAVFVFHVVNAGANLVELRFSSGQAAEITVYDVDTDAPVWQWSDDKMFTQAIVHETVEPGETLEFECTWNDPPTGDYIAIATLEAAVDVEARTTFSVR